MEGLGPLGLPGLRGLALGRRGRFWIYQRFYINLSLLLDTIIAIDQLSETAELLIIGILYGCYCSHCFR